MYHQINMFDEFPEEQSTNNCNSCQPPTGEELKDKGIKKVEKHNSTWLESAIIELKHIANFLSPIQKNGIPADQIRNAISYNIGEPDHSNAWGAFFRKAIKEGILKDTGRVAKSMIPSAHSRRVAIYNL